jgi:hypothetical protein
MRNLTLLAMYRIRQEKVKYLRNLMPVISKSNIFSKLFSEIIFTIIREEYSEDVA